ncbi:MAG: serine hydrolase [Nitrospirota bacterium]
MINKNTIIEKAVIPAICLLLGLFAGYYLYAMRVGGDVNKGFYEKREGGYQLINPLLECEGGSNLFRNKELRPFKKKVEGYLRERMRYPGVETASVYFRELNDGIWFSIGETERFTPASLRKVPMMIAVLKQEERDPNLLARKVRFQLRSDHTLQQIIKPSSVMTRETEYTVEELLRRMIVYSDNNAYMVLSANVDLQEFNRTYEALNIPSPDAVGPSDFLSIQTYASFFRVLYNATYLNKVRSEQALALLTQIDFKSGIVAGLPKDLPVAHKFGEHRDDDTGKIQLHDCGIVYYPQHPYLLCIMTRGSSLEYLDDAISAISRIIYLEVNTQYNVLHD